LRRVINNPQLWVILIILLSITILYYLDLFFLQRSREWLWNLRVIEYVNHINGSLFYLPIVYAIATLGWRGTLFIGLASFVLALPRVIYFSSSLPFLISNIIFLIIPILIALLVILVRKLIEGARKSFKERESERQEYMSQVFRAQEEERKRIAQELHDDTIQSLLAVANRIQSLVTKEGSNFSQQATHQLHSLRALVLDISKGLRRLSINLRPSILDDLGLIEALRSLVDSLCDNTFDVRIVINGVVLKFPPENDVTIFRFIQEALNNARKHSEANAVVVTLDFELENVKITVQDNGKGFILPSPISRFTTMSKLGIVGMQERARALGGTFNIDTQLGIGTIISLTFKAPVLNKQ